VGSCRYGSLLFKRPLAQRHNPCFPHMRLAVRGVRTRLVDGSRRRMGTGIIAGGWSIGLEAGVPRIRSGEEQDVYTGWRRLLAWTGRAGAVARVKRRTHRRDRRESRQRLRGQDWD